MPVTPTTRSLTFTIPGSPALKVIATENNGKIDFTVDVQDTPQLTGDLRGFFFDTNEAKMAGMKVTGTSLLTQAKVGANAILDLGNGDTMAAKTSAKFDVGLEIGTVGFAKDDVSGALSFTLSNAAANLTLDDVAGMRFGAKIDSVGAVGTARSGTQTLLATAAAAPDAKDDVFTIKEDGATAGGNTVGMMAAASGATKAVTLNVLANDVSADRAPLTIIGIGTGPAHGSVAISTDGKSLLYTPTQDYSGADTFQYGVSDGKGGIDYATVNLTVTPVADAPVISFTTSAGAHINETIVHVTAKVTDLDGSEVISAITPAGLSAGQTLVAVAGQAGTLHAVAGPAGTYTQDFLLTTDKTQSYHEDLNFTATAKEVANNALASTMGSTHYDYDYRSTTSAVEFTAYNQNMFTGGNALGYDYNEFLGIDLGDYKKELGIDFDVGKVYAGAEFAFKVGLDTHIHIDGGSIDAVADYDIKIDSAYNKTLDTLELDTHGDMTNLAVSTQSPEGSIYLAMIVKAIARVYVGFELGIDVPLIGFIGISDEYDIGPSININKTQVLVDANSEGAHSSVTFPEPFESLSLDFAWPTIRTSESGTSSSLTNSGDSENFLSLGLDVDKAVSQIINYLADGEGLDNYFNFEGSVGPLDYNLVLYDAKLAVDAYFKQKFVTKMDDVTGILNFEDGTHQTFTLGEAVTIKNASAIDAAGNHDGHVDYTIDFVPAGTVESDTSIGFDVNYSQTIGKFHVGISTPSPLDDIDINIGPLRDDSYKFPVGEITVLDSTFALHFQHQSLAFFA